MYLKHVGRCSDHFNYGQINNSILADSFFWREDEHIDLSPVLEFIQSKSTKEYAYLITTKTCWYPIGTMDKHLKLWNSLSKRYNLQCIRQSEKQVELKRFCVYFGMAEISWKQMHVALEILQKDFFHSCIILSDMKLDLIQSLERFMTVFPQKNDYSLKFTDVINSTCEQQEVITFIWGCNGSTVNYFHLPHLIDGNY